MARPISEKVKDIRQRLLTRIRQGVHRPGDRFLSTRELAATFGISYQTAHRLIQQLTEEGLLERYAGSGTFLPGAQILLESVQLLFSARGRRLDSFGARLFSALTQRLDRDQIAWKVTWWESGEVRFARETFPVIWECPTAMEKCIRQRRIGLLLNERPQPGLGASFLDSVSIDDFSGGACAAELLNGQKKKRTRMAILSGPDSDPRSNQRRDGFLSHIAEAKVIQSQSWFYEDGYHVAGEAVKAGRHGLFCCNDRLAQSVFNWCSDHHRKCPRLVGFDDAPIAEQLNLTTIAIPWDEIIAGATEIIRRRISGDYSAARQLILTPRPVIRRL
jgi:DNA-binding MarR family transcriptional regulator